MGTLYDKDYYENGVVTGKSLYTNYQWMPELTIPMCCDLVRSLGITETESVLDYGCAKGYMVRGLRLLGIDAYGYDISRYALDNAPSDVMSHLYSTYPCRHFDWIISKDVFEHIPYSSLSGILNSLECKKLFVAVPLGKDGHYEVPAYELDTTHVIREPLEWWIDEIEKAGFHINYAGYSYGKLKKNWSKFERGNGFIIGEKI